MLYLSFKLQLNNWLSFPSKLNPVMIQMVNLFLLVIDYNCFCSGRHRTSTKVFLCILEGHQILVRASNFLNSLALLATRFFPRSSVPATAKNLAPLSILACAAGWWTPYGLKNLNEKKMMKNRPTVVHSTCGIGNLGWFLSVSG